jgi:hypothetical protein
VYDPDTLKAMNHQATLKALTPSQRSLYAFYLERGVRPELAIEWVLEDMPTTPKTPKLVPPPTSGGLKGW